MEAQEGVYGCFLDTIWRTTFLTRQFWQTYLHVPRNLRNRGSETRAKSANRCASLRLTSFPTGPPCEPHIDLELLLEMLTSCRKSATSLILKLLCRHLSCVALRNALVLVRQFNPRPL